MCTVLSTPAPALSPYLHFFFLPSRTWKNDKSLSFHCGYCISIIERSTRVLTCWVLYRKSASEISIVARRSLVSSPSSHRNGAAGLIDADLLRLTFMTSTWIGYIVRLYRASLMQFDRRPCTRYAHLIPCSVPRLRIFVKEGDTELAMLIFSEIRVATKEKQRERSELI